MDGVAADPRALTTESSEGAGTPGGRGSGPHPDHEGDPGRQAASAGDAWPDAVEVAPGVLSLGGAVPAPLGHGSLPAAQTSRAPRPDQTSFDSPPGASAASEDHSGEGRSGQGRGKQGPRRARRPWRGHGLGPARMVLAVATAGLVAVAALAVARDAAARTGRGADVTNSGVGWQTEAVSPGVDDSLPGQEPGSLATSEASPSEASPSEPVGSDAGAPVSREWAAVVRALDERRAATFARADPTAVAGYALPGSPAFEADVALLEELAAGHQRAIGVSTRLVSVDPDESLAAPGSTASATRDGAPAARVRLAVVDERSAYELVADSGQSRTVQASGPRQWLITLEQGPGDDVDGIQWRIVRVDPGR